MPNYSYECVNGHQDERTCSIAEMEEFEAGKPACACGAPLQRVYRSQKPVRFHEGWYEHIANDPVYITSAQQLADVARQNGNRSLYMKEMGTLWNVKPDNRWI